MGNIGPASGRPYAGARFCASRGERPGSGRISPARPFGRGSIPMPWARKRAPVLRRDVREARAYPSPGTFPVRRLVARPRLVSRPGPQRRPETPVGRCTIAFPDAGSYNQYGVLCQEELVHAKARRREEVCGAALHLRGFAPLREIFGNHAETRRRRDVALRRRLLLLQRRCGRRTRVNRKRLRRTEQPLCVSASLRDPSLFFFPTPPHTHRCRTGG